MYYSRYSNITGNIPERYHFINSVYLVSSPILGTASTHLSPSSLRNQLAHNLSANFPHQLSSLTIQFPILLTFPYQTSIISNRAPSANPRYPTKPQQPTTQHRPHQPQTSPSPPKSLQHNPMNIIQASLKPKWQQQQQRSIARDNHV
jgi:hypothetical protein